MRREPILLQATRFNILPHRFLHRGVEQRVQKVEHTWDVGKGWRQQPGHYFRVRCQDGASYDLFHDVTLNAWFVDRGRWFLRRGLRSTATRKAALRWNFT